MCPIVGAGTGQPVPTRDLRADRCRPRPANPACRTAPRCPRRVPPGSPGRRWRNRIADRVEASSIRRRLSEPARRREASIPVRRGWNFCRSSSLLGAGFSAAGSGQRAAVPRSRRRAGQARAGRWHGSDPRASSAKIGAAPHAASQRLASRRARRKRTTEAEIRTVTWGQRLRTGSSRQKTFMKPSIAQAFRVTSPSFCTFSDRR